MQSITPALLTSRALASQFTSAAFTLSQAQLLGVSRHQLATACQHGHLARSRRGLYFVRSDFERLSDVRERHLVLCDAVVRSAGDAVISHESAAIVHRLAAGRGSGTTPLGERVQVTMSGAHRSRGSNFNVCGSQLLPQDFVVVDGLPVTSVVRTAVDLARKHRLPDALIVVDSAARRLISDSISSEADAADLRAAVHDEQLAQAVIAQLHEPVSRMRGWKGVGYARAAIELANPAAESPLESLSRFNAYEAGIPAALIGWPVRGESGRRYWADFLWKDHRVIGEADGKSKYGLTADVLFAEKEREDDLRRAGFDVVRWSWDDAVVNPTKMIRRLELALR